MLRAAGIDWSGCTLYEERLLEISARNRLQAEAVLASMAKPR